MKAIQLRLGHSRITTTLETYGHLLPGLDDSLVASLDDAWTADDGREDGDDSGTVVPIV